MHVHFKVPMKLKKFLLFLVAHYVYFSKRQKKKKISKREKSDFLPSKVPFLVETVVPEPGNEFGSNDVLGGSMDLFTL